MYIDLIILALVILIVVMFFKRFSSFVFLMAIIEISLRILAYIKYNIGLKDVAALIGKYFPESILNIIDKYTGNWGVFNDIFRWCFVFIMMIFLSYIIKIFLNKKKI